MNIYKINGKYRPRSANKKWRSFSKFIESENEKNAIEWVYSLMGSEHGLTRNLIKIDEVKIVE